jgi:uncharacterized protein YerC
MAQVSKRTLSDKEWQVIWANMVVVFTSSLSKTSRDVFLRGLLTEVEQVMLAKRLMVCLLFQSGWEVVSIAGYLHMSTSTVYKTSSLYSANDAYQKVLRRAFPRTIDFNPDLPPESFWKLLVKELLVSKATRYRQIRKLSVGG